MSGTPESNPIVPAWVARKSRVIVAVAGVASAAALVAGFAAPAAAQAAAQPVQAGVTGHTVTAGTVPAAVVANRTEKYWTRSRMLSARNVNSVTVKAGTRSPAAPSHPSAPAGRVAGAAPAGAGRGAVRPTVRPMGSTGGPWTGNSSLPPATTSGKVFFTTTGNGKTENWVCSGSTVNSNGKDVIFTAGHCVYGTIGGQVPGETWHSNWEFVPDYNNGSAPYGVWTAKQLWTLNAYIANADEGDDIGAAVANTNSSGQHIVNVVGGQGIAWNEPETEAVYDFGYPAQSPFTGLTLQWCNGSEFNASSIIASTMGLACNFTGGSSGGPWLMSFGGEFGYVTSVNDYTENGNSSDIYGAYFGNNAETLYDDVANL